MRLCLYITFFASAALAQGYFETSCQYQGKDVQCEGGAFCAMGEGKNGSEARNDALKNIARQVSSSINAADSSIYRQSESVSSRGKRSSESEETVRTEVVKSVLENVALKTFEPATTKNKVNIPAYVCKSDVAKSYSKQQSLIADSLKMACQVVLGEHPKGKNEAWHRAQMLWGKFLEIQNQFDSWGIEKTALFRSTSETYAKARDSYAGYCNQKVYWTDENANEECSKTVFSKLSGSINIEKSKCLNGLNLKFSCPEKTIYSSYGLKYSLEPSLTIESCQGKQRYSQLKADAVTGLHKENAAVAKEKMHESLSNSSFLEEWKNEIKKWGPQCVK